jgi:anti-sigma regulatory factor (Ser/Thr protein kinase)
MTQLRAVIDLPADARAPAVARTLVRTLARTWRLPDLAEDAQLIVSELVTNALRHAPGPGSLELEVIRRGRGLRIALVDGSAVRPLVRELSPQTPTGRGMAIVQAISAGWGADDHHGGKRVWVDLAAPA